MDHFESLFTEFAIILLVLCFHILAVRHIGSQAPSPPALEGKVLNYWTAREVPQRIDLKSAHHKKKKNKLLTL